jgi:hypothetical protein
MNEQIRIRLTTDGAPLAITMTRDGVVLRGESGAAPRRVRLALQPFGAPTRKRVEQVQQREGWPRGRFDLNVTGMTDGVALAGVKPNTLPPGIYDGRLSIDDLRLSDRGTFRVEIPEHGAADTLLQATEDPRQVRLSRPLQAFPDAVRRLLVAPASVIDGQALEQWLDSMTPRASRKACLLNVLAKLASAPAAVADTVESIFFADVDRIYTEVGSGCAPLLQQLAMDPRRPFFPEGTPKAEVHFRMLDRAGVARADYELRSFRQAGRNSLQVVTATPKPGRGSRRFAEFDIDLGNPLEDVVGFVVHLGELLDSSRTDHFALRSALMASPAGEFLFYDVVEPHVTVRMVEGV